MHLHAYKITVFLLSLCLSYSCLAGEIALSFDDTPTGDKAYFSGSERTTRLIKQLEEANIEQVVFFCNTNKFDEAGIKRVNKYRNAGHLIANHSHSHKDFNKTESELFIQDFLKANRILSDFETTQWFRYPFLRQGDTIAKRDKMRSALKAHGYRHGYVTVDNYDWYMDHLFQKAIQSGKQVNFDKLKETYIQILWEGIRFYDAMAIEVLGYSPKHVLLLHENDLAALFIKGLVEHIRAQGWQVISPEEAYADPIADIQPETLYLQQGQIAAIAKDKGYSGALVSKWEKREAIERQFLESGAF